MHDVRTPGCAGLPDVDNRLIVAVEQEFFAGPAMTPDETGKGNGKEFLPLDRV
jgi:hypothetical protein